MCENHSKHFSVPKPARKTGSWLLYIDVSVRVTWHIPQPQCFIGCEVFCPLEATRCRYGYNKSDLSISSGGPDTNTWREAQLKINQLKRGHNQRKRKPYTSSKITTLTPKKQYIAGRLIGRSADPGVMIVDGLESQLMSRLLQLSYLFV